ncbi:cellulase family glycosylhydrolase [Haloterrigena sp. SYSU A121-1]|uniref:Cellulase family glycosylhydrolase n=1 Tax=Haloterrigena gelatinilytica TaxID=2741724 RepID=A0A8J8GN83_9EURY|nr:cellulase family glycosylhydrolase [Haloterrigena gelatinilytica]NUB92766.1 cellulase family glycosylhydrolase [Haloterrigena gelatinilytica]
MHRRRYLASLSASSVAALAGCSSQRTDGPVTAGPPRLTVEGRWVTDPDGNPVVLRGVSLDDPVWSLEHAAVREEEYWDAVRLATDDDAGWHARVLRLPITPRSISDAGMDAVVDALDRAVELAAERGVYLLVDYHASERYDTSSIDRRLRSFWDRVAPRYADDAHVLYELFGAPTEPAAGGLEAWRTWRDRATPWLSRVRDRAPETPIVVGSPAWSSMTAHAAEEPFDHDGLLYSAHVYPSWDPRSWEAAFGTPAFDVPVFVTEWGYTAAAGAEAAGADAHLIGSTAEWGEPFREWVDAHENVHWCAATFGTRRQPAMFDADWSLPDGDDHMGALVKDWLADRRDDHRPGRETPIPSGEGSPPAAPGSVRIEEVHETRATVRWERPPDPDGDDVLQYRVIVDDREPSTLRGVERATELSNLDPDREYEVRVTAVDERGLESDPASVRFSTLDRTRPAAIIPRTASNPVGDEDGAWSAAEPHAADMLLWTDRPLENAITWRALWDETALYVRIDLTDIEDWQDTFAEVYLDLDNSREETYDGENDLDMIVPRGGRIIWQSANTAPISDGSSVTTTETDGGWRAEFTIPWREYGVRPIVGHRFGMDVHTVVEEDGERIAKFGWFDESDDAWADPRKFATVELGE